MGPALSLVQPAFGEAAFFHVEMFIALPGKRAALLRERETENDYLRAIDRPQNLIFVREAGAPWDLYTLGFYPDIANFAASADVPEARRESAARAAGLAAAVQALLNLPLALGAIRPVTLHLFTVGWITQMIFGVAIWRKRWRGLGRPRLRLQRLAPGQSDGADSAGALIRPRR